MGQDHGQRLRVVDGCATDPVERLRDYLAAHPDVKIGMNGNMWRALQGSRPLATANNLEDLLGQLDRLGTPATG